MTGRVIIITGANSGIGFEAAKKLCEAGNNVILACRDEVKGKAAVENILKENPNALATYLQLDLADMASIRKFVEDFHALGKKLNVLVNNAGLFLKGDDRVRQFTKDNFELTMGTNHLGPFLLTHLLLEDLKKTGKETGDSRIVMVSSSLHDVNERMNRGSSVLDLDNFFLDKEGTYSGQQAYKNSKVAMVMSTYSLAQQLEGTGVSVTCMNPGFIPTTDLSRHASSVARFMLRYLMAPMFKLAKITRTVDHGSKMIVDLSISEKYQGVSGKYFDDFEEKESSEESRDEDLQKRLYELSARYCCLDGYEALTAPAPPPPEEKPVKSPKAKTPKKKSKEEKEEKEAKETTENDQNQGKGGPDVEGIKFVDEEDKPEEEKPEDRDGEPAKVTVTVEDTSKGEDTGNHGNDGEKKNEGKTEEIMEKGKAIEQEEAKVEVAAQ